MSADAAWLAEEQAALRRVATLVAGAPDPHVVFEAVAREAAELLDMPVLTLTRFEPDGTATVVAATSNRPYPVGANFALDGPGVIATIRATGRSARIDSYEGLPGAVAATLRAAGVRSGYGVPIIVDGRVWGAMSAVEGVVAPDDVEARLEGFTELVATAISTAQARAELSQLAAGQASLRRVATLVAHGSVGDDLLPVVAAEVRELVGVPDVAVVRYEQREVVVVGAAGGNPRIQTGGRWTLDGPSVCARVLDSGRPARLDDYRGLPGTVAHLAQTAGFQSVAGAPIVADGRVWGAIVLVSGTLPLPDRAEVRVAEYAELVATAISNATTRAELLASRARIVAAGDEARKRIERNLHDGIQQRLIALALDVQALHGHTTDAAPRAQAGLERLARDIESALEEVREISRGLHPPLLARRGLRAPLSALARRSPIPVELRVSGSRAPEPVEVAAYYAVSEALTNAIKYSQAAEITIAIEIKKASLRAVVQDDGVGGALMGDGTGLRGLLDRINALGGTLAIRSPAGAGTQIAISLPFPG